MRVRKITAKDVLLSISGILALLIIWELAVRMGLVSARILSPPSKVVETFLFKLTNTRPDGATIQTHFLMSLRLAVSGFVVACVIGIPLGLVMGYFKSLEYFFNPIFEIVRPIPPIAWIPIIMLLLGIGMASKVFIIFISAFVPSVINSYVGVKRTNPVLINVAKTSGASDWKIFTTVCIPSAVPMIFAGMKITLGAAWSTLVAAELLASSVGLGYMIQKGRTLIRPDIIIVGMLVIGITGSFLGWLLSRLEKKIAPWRKKK